MDILRFFDSPIQPQKILEKIGQYENSSMHPHLSMNIPATVIYLADVEYDQLFSFLNTLNCLWLVLFYQMWFLYSIQCINIPNLILLFYICSNSFFFIPIAVLFYWTVFDQ